MPVDLEAAGLALLVVDTRASARQAAELHADLEVFGLSLPADVDPATATPGTANRSTTTQTPPSHRRSPASPGS